MWETEGFRRASLGDTKQRRPTATPVVARRIGRDLATVETLRDCDILVDPPQEVLLRWGDNTGRKEREYINKVGVLVFNLNWSLLESADPGVARSSYNLGNPRGPVASLTLLSCFNSLPLIFYVVPHITSTLFSAIKLGNHLETYCFQGHDLSPNTVDDVRYT